MSRDAAGVHRVTEADLRALVVDVLRRRGVPSEGAAIVAEALVEADLCGHESHGVIRLPKWVDGLRSGAINADASPRTCARGEAVALLDGDRGLGPIVGEHAASLAISIASRAGIGAVAVRRASHIGMLGFYTRRMAGQGFVGLVMTNTEPAMAPFGGRDRVLGTNPLSLAAPGRDEPIVLDMSTSVVARGKIVVARERGTEIPPGWAVDADGRVTTDPTAALAGSLLPVGGPKGYGLAVMVDLLTGGLAGAAVGTGVSGTYRMSSEGTKGDLFVAIAPAHFGPPDEFLDRVDALKRDIRESRPAPGVTRIYLPGEVESDSKRRRLAEGIPITAALWHDLRRLRDGDGRP